MSASGLSCFFVSDDLRLMVQNLAVQFVGIDAQGDQNNVRDHFFHAAVTESNVSETILQLRKGALRMDGTVNPMINYSIGQNIGFRLHPVLLE